MKGCIMGGIVLVLVTVLVALNAVYIRSFVGELSDGLAELPTEPDPEETPAELRKLAELFESQMPVLMLSVSVSATDRVAEGLLSAEAYAATGDTEQYRAAVAVLKKLVEDIGQLERFSVKNLL